MTITKRGFIALAACALAASLFAGHHRPFPHGTPPGAYWCTKCGGDGYNWTWYGWKKTCGVCDGRSACPRLRLPARSRSRFRRPRIGPRPGPCPRLLLTRVRRAGKCLTVFT